MCGTGGLFLHISLHINGLINGWWFITIDVITSAYTVIIGIYNHNIRKLPRFSPTHCSPPPLTAVLMYMTNQRSCWYHQLTVMTISCNSTPHTHAHPSQLPACQLNGSSYDQPSVLISKHNPPNCHTPTPACTTHMHHLPMLSAIPLIVTPHHAQSDPTPTPFALLTRLKGAGIFREVGKRPSRFLVFWGASN